ncbi:ABC transporter permease [Xylocopilactobacillus apis]|uniref:Permease n=1 Tax=Xylocopilactobacillus apis TaxID=2932183 RepID=A0AAU9CXE9_9LACO|nr:ABC transporter permease [Xylocopilactobacillus apis]BDR57081.1 permease [Xylocopilactobacillus apis]
MKIFDILHSASANLWHNKSRTILTVIAIMIGAMTIALTVGVNSGVNDYVSKQVANVGDKGLVMIIPSSSAGSNDKIQKYDPNRGNANEQESITPSKMKRLKEMSELKNVQGVQDTSIDYIQSSNSAKYVFQASSPIGINVDLKAGRQAAKKGQQNEVVLAGDYVKALGFKSAKQAIGQKVKIAVSSKATNRQSIIDAKVVGVRNVSIVQGNQSIISQSLADQVSEHNLAGLPQKMQQNYVGATALIKNPTDDNIAKVKNNLKKKGYQAQTFQDQIGQLRQVVNAITGVLILFGAIALLAASFGVINTLYMSVRDRTREIGLMKALGLGRGKVFSIFSCESILIGLIGSILGIIVAILVGSGLNSAASNSFLKGLPGFTLIKFTFPSICMIIILIMFIAFLAGTLPARRASKLDPITALRYE